MTGPRVVAAGTLALLVAPAATQAPPGFERAWQDAVQRFERDCAKANVVGAALAFAHGRHVLGHATHGHADLASGRRVDRDTVFHWASITKTLTAISAMQLRDRGRLRLDDPIVDHLPELREVHDPFGPMRAITIRHLLSHSSGFRGPTWPWGGDKAWQPHEPTRWSQLVAMMPYTEIGFEPGSRFGYSNPGLVFVGRVVELLSGDDFEVYVHKNLLLPLGMYHSYFDGTPYHLLRHRSNNYRIENGRPVAGGLDFDTGITTSNGGLNAPLPDMLRYLAFLCGDVDPDSDAARVLKRSSLEEMWQPLLPVSRGQDDMQQSIGLGFFVLDRDGERYVGHTGGQKSFVSFFYVHPATETAALGAFNTATAGPVMADLRAHLMDTMTPLFR